MRLSGSAPSPRWVTQLVLLLLIFSIPAWARSYRISKYITDIHVDNDGSARVSEHITFVFVGQFEGIHRSIPVDYPGPNGTNYSLFVNVQSVTGDDGSPLKFTRNTKDHYLRLTIYIPGAVDTTKTVNIEYTAPNATKFFDHYDEFYWNVTGNDWVVPIDYVAATIYFPQQASGELRAQAFSGMYGSSNKERAQVEGSVVTAETANPLPIRAGLTVDVYIPQGLLHAPGSFTKLNWFVRSNPVLTLPVWAFLVMFVLWWLKGRDPDPGMSVAPMYEPPKNMGPAEVGTLIDDSVDPRDISSVLVDLAVRGYIKIVETKHKVLLFSSKDYELQLLKERGQWQDLTSYERTMLERIFYSGDTVMVSDLRNHFYTAIPTLKSQIMTALKQKGMYTVDPDSAAGYWVVGVMFIAIPYALLQWSGTVDFFSGTLVAIISIAIAVVIVIWLGSQLTAKSLLGARTRIQILGFEEFMNRVDADRLKRMPPDTFEKYLPYAMALGVEHRWAKAFEGIAQNAPAWYQAADAYPGNMFSSFYFVNSLSSMTHVTSSAFTAAPRSSSGSSGWGGGGFSGGGFSGGGFGGGGGDAF
jgi:uncharacterized membrane protein